jgi:hypothetical protein
VIRAPVIDQRHDQNVWNGDAAVDELDHLVTSDYRGHLGSRDRDLVQLKRDIVAYRGRVDDVRFVVLHRFSAGEYDATRLLARAVDPTSGARLSAAGINISRWRSGLLAEEWAAWESLEAGT